MSVTMFGTVWVVQLFRFISSAPIQATRNIPSEVRSMAVSEILSVPHGMLFFLLGFEISVVVVSSTEW